MKKLFVTGGAGFIGSNFVKYILKNFSNYNIVNFDMLTYAGNLENLSDIENDERYTFIKGDITDRDQVKKAMNGCDIVVHFAAESHVDRSIEGPMVFVHTNVVGTEILLECAKEYEVDKFIHVSTDEVYGSLGKTGFFTEETPLSPNSPYSASKTGSDLLVRAYCETFGFPGIITRCSNNYGPNQFPEKLIPLILSNALEDKDLPVYGDGKNIRDWLYVEDHCSAIATVMEKGKFGEVYNIGGNNEWQNIDIVKLILKELGKPESLIKFVTDRLGHDRRYAIDAAKIKNELGWEPSVQFPEGIKKTIKWYLDNPEWIANIKSGEYMQNN